MEIREIVSFSTWLAVSGIAVNIIRKIYESVKRAQRRKELESEQEQAQKAKEQAQREKEQVTQERKEARRRKLESGASIAEMDLQYTEQRLKDVKTRLKQIDAEIWVNIQTGQGVKNEKLSKERNRLQKEQLTLEKQSEKDYFTIRERDIYNSK